MKQKYASTELYPFPVQEDLLQRLLTSDKIGALLKGLGVSIRNYVTGAVVPNTLWKNLGYTSSRLSGDKWKRYVHPEDSALVESYDHRLRSGEADTWSGEYRVRDKEGVYHHIHHKSLVLERAKDGTPTLLVGWDLDVSDSIQRIAAVGAECQLQERRFHESETIRTAGAMLSSELDPIRAAERVLALAARVVNYDSAAVWTISGNELVQLAYRGSSRSNVGRRKSISDASYNSLLELRGPRILRDESADQPAIMEIPLIVRGRLEGFLEFRSTRKDAYGVEEASAAIKFSDHAVVALANAFRYQAAELEASTDWLTGLPTRRSFMSNASRMEEAAPGVSFSVLMIDIDHFKKVNDSFGHPVGDTVLAAVADVCRSAFRTKDLFCRYGGEEIVALLPGAAAETAVKVAERVRTKVECLRIQDYPEMRLSVSIGVCAGERGVDFRELIARADEALYMAKESGRNRCELR